MNSHNTSTNRSVLQKVKLQAHLHARNEQDRRLIIRRASLRLLKPHCLADVLHLEPKSESWPVPRLTTTNMAVCSYNNSKRIGLLHPGRSSACVFAGTLDVIIFHYVSVQPLTRCFFDLKYLS